MRLLVSVLILFDYYCIHVSLFFMGFFHDRLSLSVVILNYFMKIILRFHI